MEAPTLPDFNLAPTPKSTNTDLGSMTQAELLTLRAEIDEKLSGMHLNDLNLVQEVLIQLKKAKILQNASNKPNSGVPVNQKAQVQNSIVKILSDLAKLQNTLFDSEQRKRLQAATIKAVKTLPPEAQHVFFEAYEPVLAEAEKRMEQILEDDNLAPDIPDFDDDLDPVEDE